VFIVRNPASISCFAGQTCKKLQSLEEKSMKNSIYFFSLLS
jgi:hypothetical protein